MADNETHEEVVKLARRELEGHERINCWFRPEFVRALIDRLEAAHKRELSKNASKNMADFGQLGNAAREMRYLASRLLREWQDAVGSNPKFSRYGCMVRRYKKGV